MSLDTITAGVSPLAHFRDHLQRGELAYQFDAASGRPVFFPRVIAPGTGNAVEWRVSAGKGTVHAMQSGVFWGYVGLIEGLVSRMTAEILGGQRGLFAGQSVTVIATGGLAPLFSRHTDAISHVDPDLMIKGLARIHAANRGAFGKA